MFEGAQNIHTIKVDISLHAVMETLAQKTWRMMSLCSGLLVDTNMERILCKYSLFNVRKYGSPRLQMC